MNNMFGVQDYNQPQKIRGLEHLEQSFPAPQTVDEIQMKQKARKQQQYANQGQRPGVRGLVNDASMFGGQIQEIAQRNADDQPGQNDNILEDRQLEAEALDSYQAGVMVDPTQPMPAAPGWPSGGRGGLLGFGVDMYSGYSKLAAGLQGMFGGR